MHQLLFVSAYTGLGGGEKIQLNLMSALDPDRWRLHLLCPREGQYPDAARAIGAEIHSVPYRGITMWFVPAIWKRFPIAHKLADLMRSEQITAVHCDYHSLPFAATAAREVGILLIWNAMGWWFPARPWQRRFFREDITQIICLSQAVRDRWLGPHPMMSPDRFRVMIPGVDPERFRPGAVDGAPVREKLGIGPDTPLVALLARFQHVKGHDVFQAMARRVHAELPEARFVVAGENVFGASRDEAYKTSILRTAETDPVLRECLSYIGFYEDPRPVIAAADVIVCPSRFESLGMVHLESMAMETPIVSMNNGGPAETVIDGETGYLVPPDDPDALADRTLKLLHDPALRVRMGTAGRGRVLALFTAERYGSDFADMVEGLI